MSLRSQCTACGARLIVWGKFGAGTARKGSLAVGGIAFGRDDAQRAVHLVSPAADCRPPARPRRGGRLPARLLADSSRLLLAASAASTRRQPACTATFTLPRCASTPVVEQAIGVGPRGLVSQLGAHRKEARMADRGKHLSRYPKHGVGAQRRSTGLTGGLHRVFCAPGRSRGEGTGRVRSDLSATPVPGYAPRFGRPDDWTTSSRPCSALGRASRLSLRRWRK
jgi:hypothetical protein